MLLHDKMGKVLFRDSSTAWTVTRLITTLLEAAGALVSEALCSVEWEHVGPPSALSLYECLTH